MSVYNNLNDTIEGEKVDAWFRNWHCNGLKKHPSTNNTMLLYVTDRNSHAKVIEAANEPEDKMIREATNHFHRDVNDAVTADALSLWVDTRRMINYKVLHGKKDASHRHGIMYSSIKVKTIATVKVPLANILKKLGFSNNQIE